MELHAGTRQQSMTGLDEGAAGRNVEQQDFVARAQTSTDDAVRFNSGTPVTATPIG
jgi:hypothetical protein